MFSGWMIGAAFVLMFLPINAFEFFEKRRLTGVLRVLAVVGTAAAVYCLAAGLFLLSGSEDPVADADPNQLGRISAGGRGRVGLVILAIKFWPYVLIGLGGFWIVVYHRMRTRLKDT